MFISILFIHTKAPHLLLQGAFWWPIMRKCSNNTKNILEHIENHRQSCTVKAALMLQWNSYLETNRNCPWTLASVNTKLQPEEFILTLECRTLPPWLQSLSNLSVTLTWRLALNTLSNFYMLEFTWVILFVHKNIHSNENT